MVNIPHEQEESGNEESLVEIVRELNDLVTKLSARAARTCDSLDRTLNTTRTYQQEIDKYKAETRAIRERLGYK